MSVFVKFAELLQPPIIREGEDYYYLSMDGGWWVPCAPEPERTPQEGDDAQPVAQ